MSALGQMLLSKGHVTCGQRYGIDRVKSIIHYFLEVGIEFERRNVTSPQNTELADIAGRLKGFFEMFQKCSPDAPTS